MHDDIFIMLLFQNCILSIVYKNKFIFINKCLKMNDHIHCFICRLSSVICNFLVA